MKAYFIDAPNLEIINWGVTNTMMRWWVANGYDPELAKKDRVAATRRLTQTLKSQHEAVWYKGKGMYKLLDGDQICVYDPSNIYEIDGTLAQPGQIGSKVRRKADGMIGVIVAMREVGDLLERHPKAGVANGGWIKPETRKILHVKWKRGGIDMNVQDVDVDFI